MSRKRIEGLYYYCLYEAERLHSNEVSREWYRRLMMRFQVKDSEYVNEDTVITLDHIRRLLLEIATNCKEDSQERESIREAIKELKI